MRKQSFALFFGNRGFFPDTLIAIARNELAEAVTKAGFDFLIPDEDMTRFGAVEIKEEGKLYAKWLMSHAGEYDGHRVPSQFRRRERGCGCTSGLRSPYPAPGIS